MAIRAANEAHAAPSMPMSKPKINIGSKIKFTKEPDNIAYIDNFGAPIARTNPPPDMANDKNGKLGNNMPKYRLA